MKGQTSSRIGTEHAVIPDWAIPLLWISGHRGCRRAGRRRPPDTPARRRHVLPDPGIGFRRLLSGDGGPSRPTSTGIDTDEGSSTPLGRRPGKVLLRALVCGEHVGSATSGRPARTSSSRCLSAEPAVAWVDAERVLPLASTNSPAFRGAVCQDLRLIPVQHSTRGIPADRAETWRTA